MRAQLRPTRLGRLERPVFTGAMAAVATNLADVSGMPLSPYSVLVIAIPLAAALVYPRLRRGGRAALALVSGLLTFPFGVINAVFHVFIYGPAWEDATGILLAVAGLALLALGVGVIARRAGDQPPLSRRRQVRRGVAAAVAAPIVLFFVVMPVLMGMFITHPIRLAAPAATLGLPHEDVSFKAADGVRLRGWYVPARNGVGVILMHGSGGNRSGTALHARMLARHGYGVLAFDQRGHGDSGGHGNLLGWNAYPDVEP
jgi:uncharacterized protein